MKSYRNRMSMEKHTRILQLHKAGLSQLKIAEAVCSSAGTVRNVLADAGVIKIGRRRDREKDKDSVFRMAQEGYDLDQITGITNYSKGYVATLLRTAGVKVGGGAKELPAIHEIPIPPGYVVLAHRQIMKAETFNRYQKYFNGKKS